jgi:hypothetical protein
VIIKQNGDIVLQMQADGLSSREDHADTREPDQPGEPGEPNPWDDVLKTRPS